MLGIQKLNTVIPAPSAETRRRRLVEQTVRRTYDDWQARFPRWANSGFDEYFLLNDALPMLDDMLAGGLYPDPALLVRKWAQIYHLTDEGAQRAVIEATPVAADLLTRLQIHYTNRRA